MDRIRYLLVVLVLLSLNLVCLAQNDTIPSSYKTKTPLTARDSSRLHLKRSTSHLYKTDSLTQKEHSPRKATLYSTVFPGLGQIYNRKYWKLPLVWAAVGIPAYTYFDNRNWYKKTQFAIAVLDRFSSVGVAVPPDSVKLVDPKLQPFMSGGSLSENQLRTYRNQFRQYEDYSALFFLLFWGLNIIDATVDAHLKGFDISNNLSVNFAQPSTPATLAGPAGPGMGISLVFDFHKAQYKTLPARP